MIPIVYYRDGGRIRLGKQEDGTLLGYESIDRSRLSAFGIEKDGKMIFRMRLDEGQRLIWRKREFHKVGTSPTVVHIVGWQKTIAGENTQCLAYIFPDGKVEVAGAFREGHPVFDTVELRDQEK